MRLTLTSASIRRTHHRIPKNPRDRKTRCRYRVIPGPVPEESSASANAVHSALPAMPGRLPERMVGLIFILIGGAIVLFGWPLAGGPLHQSA
jgi:hypothetical protein